MAGVPRAGSITPLTYEILLALADEDRHGYGILKEIEGRSGPEGAPSTGAMYLALQRMQSDGLIDDGRAPAGVETDARRRYYTITPSGRALAEEESRRLEALLAAAREKRLLGGAAS